MRADMGGAACVAGTLFAVSRLNLPVCIKGNKLIYQYTHHHYTYPFLPTNHHPKNTHVCVT